MQQKNFYSIADIMSILQISKQTAYDFIKITYQNQKPFKILKIITQYKIPVESFNHWFYGMEEYPKDEISSNAVYTVKDIGERLGTTKQTTYNYVKSVSKKSEPYRVLRIMSSYRIPKRNFDTWYKEVCNDISA